MGNTSEGAKQAAITAKKIHGENWHKSIGAVGGSKSHSGYFGQIDKATLRAISAKGGKAKRDRKSKEV